MPFGLLAARGGIGFFEANVSRGNLFRGELVATPYAINVEGCVHPSEAPGIRG